MPSRCAAACDLGVLGVQEDVALRGEQVALVGHRGRGLDAVGVVEHEAEVADAPDAGLRADRRLADLDARVAERALLGLAGAVVEVDLLVRAARDAVAPAAAAVLVDEDDAVLLALVHRARRARGDARRVQAVLADPRQEEHERLLVGQAHLLLHALQVRVVRRELRAAGEALVPVGPPREVHRLAGELGVRARDGVAVSERRVDERLVVVGERLVVVVDRGQVGVGEDRQQLLDLPAGLQSQPALAVELPAAVPARLVGPLARIALPGLGLDVVEPDVLGAGPVGPDLLAGDRAGVAADALVEVHDHRDLRLDAHQYSTSWLRLRTIVIESRLDPVGP